MANAINLSDLDFLSHHRKVLKFYGVAREMSRLSKDRSTQVGALALGTDYEILGIGYNGFPRGIDDRVEARHERPTKYMYTSHAEENIVATAARVGVSLRGSTVIVTSLHPCTTCSRLMIQAGVREVFAPYSDNERWKEEGGVAAEMLREAGVRINYYEEPKA